MSEQVAKAIINYLKIQFTNPNLCVLDLQNEFEITKKELTTIIRNETGKSFYQFLNGLRIEMAKELLDDGNNLTIAELGFKVGYNSPSNFGRVFLKYVGVSPGHYRK